MLNLLGSGDTELEDELLDLWEDDTDAEDGEEVELLEDDVICIGLVVWIVIGFLIAFFCFYIFSNCLDI